MVSSKLTRLVACIALLSAVGCTTSRYADIAEPCDAQLCKALLDEDGPRPVADVSGAQLFLPHFFTGISVAQVWPFDSSLVHSTVFDVNMAFDLGSFMTFEVLVGYWDLADRPGNVPNADSQLIMQPVVAFLQIYTDIPKWRSRYYWGAGMGYSINSYNLGSKHELYVEATDSLVDYNIDVSDGTLMKTAFGWEFYSSADAQLNLALELSYIVGQADLTIERVTGVGTDEYLVGDFPIDDMWMFRANFTWHF